MALTYSFPNFEPVHCSTFDSNCYFLTCKQFSRETCRLVWYLPFFKSIICKFMEYSLVI